MSRYGGVLVNVMINGTQAEIQINIPEMIGAKLAEGHKLFEIERSLPKGHGMVKTVVDAQSMFYAAASEAAERRSPSEQGNRSDLTRDDGTSSPDLSSRMNISSPGSTTNNRPTSDSKNLQPGGNLSGSNIKSTSLPSSISMGVPPKPSDTSPSALNQKVQCASRSLQRLPRCMHVDQVQKDEGVIAGLRDPQLTCRLVPDRQGEDHRLGIDVCMGLNRVAGGGFAAQLVDAGLDQSR
jgi:hypothetical protein